jgi:hypothetical protein
LSWRTFERDSARWNALSVRSILAMNCAMSSSSEIRLGLISSPSP